MVLTNSARTRPSPCSPQIEPPKRFSTVRGFPDRRCTIFSKSPAIVHVEQRDDVRIAVSDMTEDRDRHPLPFEEVFQVADQLADAFGRDDDIIDKIDRLLLRIESIERRIERLPRFPELLPLLGIERQRQLRRQLDKAGRRRPWLQPALGDRSSDESASSSTSNVAAASAGMPCFPRPIKLSVLASMTSNALGWSVRSCGTASPTSSRLLK